MDTIVNKISEIETAAVKIMNESALQKKELDEESKQRMDAYDADVDKRTEAKLADIRVSLETRKKQSFFPERSRCQDDHDSGEGIFGKS